MTLVLGYLISLFANKSNKNLFVALVWIWVVGGVQLSSYTRVSGLAKRIRCGSVDVIFAEHQRVALALMQTTFHESQCALVLVTHSEHAASICDRRRRLAEGMLSNDDMGLPPQQAISPERA